MSGSEPPEETVNSKITFHFTSDVIKEALKTHNSKCKHSDDCIALMSELCKTLVIEASLRAAKQAQNQNQHVVNLEHIESILPQLMLDFP